MKTFIKKLALFTLVIASIGLQSCNKDKNSIAKIFVRSVNNELQSNTRVVIIADVEVNESKIEYVDTLMTNSAGYAEFNLNDYYEKVGKKIRVAEFDVLCKKYPLTGEGRIRTRYNTVAVETIRIIE